MIIHRNLEALLIFCLGLIIFISGLSSQEIVGFEARFYLFALEMWRHGPSWFPMTYHEPYPDYPVASTFLIYLAAKTFGTLNKLIAVLPSAMAAAIVLATTYLIGALHSRRWGFFAVCFLMFTLAFISEARTISLDNYTAAVTAITFYLAYSASLSKTSPAWAAIFISFIVGFVFRGPIGLVIPTGVLCVFYLLEKEFKSVFIVATGGALLLVISSGVLLALAHHVGGTVFLQDVVHMEVLNRLKQNQTPPFYFYFINSLGTYFICYPLAVAMLLLMGNTLFRYSPSKDIQFLQKLLGWMAVILIGLSLPADKKVRYILPVAPAFALFCAYLFVVPRSQTYLIYLRKVAYWLSLVFPAICLVILYLGYKKQFALNYLFLLGFFVTLQISMILYHLFSRRRELLVVLTATISFVIVYIGVFEPINLELNRTRDFVIKVEDARHQQNAQLIFYQEDPDGLPIKYIVDMLHEEPLKFIKNPAQLSAYSGSAFFIVSEENFRHLPPFLLRSVQVLYRGKIGHVQVIVFSKNVFPRAAGS